MVENEIQGATQEQERRFQLVTPRRLEYVEDGSGRGPSNQGQNTHANKNRLVVHPNNTRRALDEEPRAEVTPGERGGRFIEMLDHIGIRFRKKEVKVLLTELENEGNQFRERPQAPPRAPHLPAADN